MIRRNCGDRPGALVLTVLADLTVAIGVGVAFNLAIRLREATLRTEDWHTPEP